MPLSLESVTPARGHTGGHTLVQIDGHGFRVRTPVAPSGPSLPPPPTVRVLFDGIPALAVEVVSEHVLRAVTPRHPPDRVVDGQQVAVGTVDVQVLNLDDAGAPIAGEAGELAAAYTYVRPELAGYMGSWTRTLIAFKEMLQELLLENVRVNPSVDYDPDTLEAAGFVELAEGPGIALMNIAFPPSAEEKGHEPEMVDGLGGYVLIRRPSLRTDIVGTIVLVGNNQEELINLGEACTHIFRDFGLFEVLKDPDDATHGAHRYRAILATAGFVLSQRFGQSAVQTMEATFGIREVQSTDLPGAPLEGLPMSPKWLGHYGTVGVTRHAARIGVTPTRKGG